MARLVVLRFSDNEEAETLVRDWSEAKNRNGDRVVSLLTPVQENDVECEVVGLFAMPTAFCDPNDGHLGHGKINRAFQRGQKYGWWVCKKCKKPTKAWGSFIQVVLGNGINHLSVFLEEQTKMEADAEQAHTHNEVHVVGVEGTNEGVLLHG